MFHSKKQCNLKENIPEETKILELQNKHLKQLTKRFPESKEDMDKGRKTRYGNIRIPMQR